MIAFSVVGLAAPLLLLWSARRNGESWPVAGALTAGARVLSGGGGLVGAFFLFFVNVAASLCGSRPLVANVCGLLVYTVVVALAIRRPRLLWLWPLAVVSGLAASTFVAYWFSAAHDYCET